MVYRSIDFDAAVLLFVGIKMICLYSSCHAKRLKFQILPSKCCICKKAIKFAKPLAKTI